MVSKFLFNRREATQVGIAMGVGASLLTGQKAMGEIEHTSSPRSMQKTLKIGMVKHQGTLTEKFAIAKQAGFDGIELNAPGFDIATVRRASDESGLPVDGTVCGSHWAVRHSSPDPEVRQQALETLIKALRDTRAVGGHTILLVVGHGDDGAPGEVWDRSTANIKQAIPVCAETGVRIAIENVWNKFLYTHDGPDNQTADQFAKYVDQFDSRWVGMQFDIGNHWKYGSPGDWIRTLGKRIIKLDIKGFSRERNAFTGITEGDLPWADVRNALDEIKFHGWVAAEVGGGKAEKLSQIAQQIDNALNLA